MSKEELCRYAWQRGMTYEGLLRVAGMIVNIEIPSREEYEIFCVESYRGMIASMVAEKYSEEDERQIARRELGWNFTEENGIER